MGVTRGTKRAAGAAGVQLNFIDPPHSGLAESKPPFRQHVAGRSNFKCQIRIFRPQIDTVRPVPFLGWRFSPPPYPHSQGDSDRLTVIYVNEPRDGESICLGINKNNDNDNIYLKNNIFLWHMRNEHLLCIRPEQFFYP